MPLTDKELQDAQRYLSKIPINNEDLNAQIIDPNTKEEKEGKLIEKKNEELLGLRAKVDDKGGIKRDVKIQHVRPDSVLYIVSIEYQYISDSMKVPNTRQEHFVMNEAQIRKFANSYRMQNRPKPVLRNPNKPKKNKQIKVAFNQSIEVAEFEKERTGFVKEEGDKEQKDLSMLSRPQKAKVKIDPELGGKFLSQNERIAFKKALNDKTIRIKHGLNAKLGCKDTDKLDGLWVLISPYDEKSGKYQVKLGYSITTGPSTTIHSEELFLTTFQMRTIANAGMTTPTVSGKAKMRAEANYDETYQLEDKERQLIQSQLAVLEKEIGQASASIESGQALEFPVLGQKLKEEFARRQIWSQGKPWPGDLTVIIQPIDKDKFKLLVIVGKETKELNMHLTADNIKQLATYNPQISYQKDILSHSRKVYLVKDEHPNEQSVVNQQTAETQDLSAIAEKMSNTLNQIKKELPKLYQEDRNQKIFKNPFAKKRTIHNIQNKIAHFESEMKSAKTQETINKIYHEAIDYLSDIKEKRNKKAVFGHSSISAALNKMQKQLEISGQKNGVKKKQ